MERRVAMWLIAISVGAGLLTGIASASHLTKLNPHTVIRDDAQGIAGGVIGRSGCAGARGRSWLLNTGAAGDAGGPGDCAAAGIAGSKSTDGLACCAIGGVEQ
jgi:hypothetical protein